MTSAGRPSFYVSCIGGLEEIVSEELQCRVPAALVAATEFGRVHFRYAGPVAPLMDLRTVEHVHAYVAVLQGVRPDRDWLNELEGTLAQTDLLPALGLLRQVSDLPAEPSFRATGFRVGAHEFRSPELGVAAGAGIVERYGWRVDLEHYDLEVRVEVRDDRGRIGIRLSPEALHHRSRLVHMRASLNPTVAAAMARLSEPTPGEVVLDPMCGAGTLLTERHQCDPEVSLLGGDRYAEKVALARTNLSHFAVPGWLVQADARCLPLADGSVDKVLCNLPWGRIVANPRLNRRLYPELLAEFHRVLRPGGLAVLLTSERNLTSGLLARRQGFRLERSLHLHIGGLEPTLYVARRV
jgi:23S rRNA G2445 N2-methylase RlmL